MVDLDVDVPREGDRLALDLDGHLRWSGSASVDELVTPNGLTDAMRLPVGMVTGPLLPNEPLSLLEYAAVFGTAQGTYPPNEPDPTGFGFPGTNRNRLTFSVPADRYVAMEFRVPTDAAWEGTAGYHMMIPGATFASATIAPCPGQFTDDALWPVAQGCTVFGEDSLRWTVGGSEGCALRPGATYYLNVINAAVDTPSVSTCTSGTCQFKLLAQFMDP